MSIVRNQPALFLLALLTIAAVLNSASLWTITVDDSYISLRYARNLLGLDGLVYNPGERVEGFSNPTWVAIMAMTLPFSSSLEGSKVIGLLAHAATVVGCAGLAAELVQPQKQAAKIALVLGTGFLVVSLPATFWPITGMETTFYAAMLLLTAWRVVVEIRQPERAPLSAVLAGLTAITRPEAPLVVGGLFLGRLVAARGDWRYTARWLGIFSVPTVGYLSFRLLYYGYPLANTYYQKGHADTLAAFLDYLRPWLNNEAPLAVLGLVGLMSLAAYHRSRAWPILLAAGGHLFFLVYVSRDWMPNQRFIVPLLPFLIVGVSVAAASLAGRLGGRLAWLPAVTLTGLIGLQGSQTLPLQRIGSAGGAIERTDRDPWMRLPDALHHTWKGHATVPIWLIERAKPGASVAYTDIGMTGWVTDLFIVDLAGLTDDRMSGATGLDWPGRAAWLGERAPDWIVLKAAGKERFEAISSSPWLVANYALEEGPNGTLAGRREGVEVASDAEILASYQLAVAREPRSRRFLWRRAIWASAVGAEADLTAACDALLPFDDMVDLIERCRSFSSRPATRPSTERIPLPASLSRHMSESPPEPAAAPSVTSAPLSMVRVPLDAPRPSPGPDNAFSLEGVRGVGADWVTYPKEAAGSFVFLDDAALKVTAHGEEIVQACDRAQPIEGATATLSGSWKLDGVEGGEAALYLAVLDGDGRRMKPSRAVKFWPLIAMGGDQGWSPVSAERALPDGAAELRLCLSVPASAGTAWFQDLQVDTK